LGRSSAPRSVPHRTPQLVDAIVRQLSPRKINAAGQPERQVGWECVHVCIDDATRLASAEVLPDTEGRDRRRLLAPRARL
jgi:hypothetical protein